MKKRLTRKDIPNRARKEEEERERGKKHKMKMWFSKSRWWRQIREQN
jgi:hypothetical protein